MSVVKQDEAGGSAQPDVDSVVVPQPVQITVPMMDSWHQSVGLGGSGCPLFLLVGGCRVSKRSGWRREDQDGCGKIPECFDSRGRGEAALRPLKVASLKQVFDFHTFHASPCSGVQGWYP